LGRRLEELGLLRQADSLARLNDDGSQFRLNGLNVVDEAKLRALGKEAIQELFANGSLGVIYAHLISLGNLSGLVDRLSRSRKGRETRARRIGAVEPDRPSGAGFQSGGIFPL
jgi:hypothetical protein